MASVSSQGVMIVRYRCGMQQMEDMTTPIEGILILCWQWHGHQIASVSFLEAVISILEEAIQPCRYGMRQMGDMSISIMGIPNPYGQWHGRQMAPASPRGVRIRQCRYG